MLHSFEMVLNMLQVDTDFFLPILAKQYFIRSSIGQERLTPFLRYDTRLTKAEPHLTLLLAQLLL